MINTNEAFTGLANASLADMQKVDSRIYNAGLTLIEADRFDNSNERIEATHAVKQRR